MQITAANLQNFDTKLIESRWLPPEKSNSFHVISSLVYQGSINLYTDTKPRVNSDNFLINDNGEWTYVDEGLGYYGKYDPDTNEYHQAIFDEETGTFHVLPVILPYPDNQDVIFTIAGKERVYSITTQGGYVTTGIFSIDGYGKYKSLTVIADTRLIVDNTLTISNTTVDIHGVLDLHSGSKLILDKNSVLKLYSDSEIYIPDDVTISIEDGSRIEIYGIVTISQSNMDEFINHSSIYLDTSAVLNVDDIPYQNREYSLTDYNRDLRNTVINVYNQGKHTSSLADIGYTWKGGSPVDHSQILDMEVLWGEAILGDYKLSVLGTQERRMANRQFLRQLIIYPGAELYIQESFHGYTYINPELYLGATIGNTDTPGGCVCNGSIYVSGSNCKITIDRHAYLYIGSTGTVTLTDGAKLVSANNGTSVALRIEGTLVIDTIEQLQGFSPQNIVFGDEGKLVILNPDTGTRNVLWTTPNGIKHSELYRLFVDEPDIYDEDSHELPFSRLRHIEYHVNKNNGIGVDSKFENYSSHMREWYNGMRLERAIKEGLIVWHSGAFIEVYNWVDNTFDIRCNLYGAARLFKHYGTDKTEYLQDVVNHFKYAGAGNIIFRFYNNRTQYKEVVMTLDDVNMLSTAHIPSGDNYNVTTDNSGTMFLRNRVPTVTVDTIIQDDSDKVMLVQGDNTITVT